MLDVGPATAGSASTLTYLNIIKKLKIKNPKLKPKTLKNYKAKYIVKTGAKQRVAFS